ncbi:hypothetical protein ACFLR4_01155 [Bacteroidota bacterium]
MRILFLSFILLLSKISYSQIYIQQDVGDSLICILYEHYSAEYDTLLIIQNPIKVYKSLENLDDFEYRKFNLNERLKFNNCIALVKPGKAIFHIDTTIFSDNNIKYHISKGDTADYIHYIGEGNNLIRIGKEFFHVHLSTYHNNYEMQIIRSHKIIGPFLELVDNQGWLNLHDKNLKLGKYYYKKY